VTTGARECSLLSILLFFFHYSLALLRLALHPVDGGGIELVLEVGGVVFLDHLDAGAAILRDLINVRAFMIVNARASPPVST
jgi:hypothetical protein